MRHADIIIRWNDTEAPGPGSAKKGLVAEDGWSGARVIVDTAEWDRRVVTFHTLRDVEAGLEAFLKGQCASPASLSELQESGVVTLDTLSGNYETREEAEDIIEAFPGRIIADAGPHRSPRFSIVTPPAVGDKVSYAFNGDSYPDGEVVRVSKSLRVVTTSTGSKFYRRRESGAWVQNGTWSLVRGHVSERNPHF